MQLWLCWDMEWKVNRRGCSSTCDVNSASHPTGKTGRTRFLYANVSINCQTNDTHTLQKRLEACRFSSGLLHRVIHAHTYSCSHCASALRRSASSVRNCRCFARFLCISNERCQDKMHSVAIMTQTLRTRSRWCSSLRPEVSSLNWDLNDNPRTTVQLLVLHGPFSVNEGGSQASKTFK